eukprot:gi/632986086/ref/XP_007910040.1/ PREDICTED: E3 ubiquitin-protein ligase TRIM17-like isoform X2 [Callorhinchus milii]
MALFVILPALPSLTNMHSSPPHSTAPSLLESFHSKRVSHPLLGSKSQSADFIRIDDRRGFVSSVTGNRLHTHTETETSFNQKVLRFKMASRIPAEILTEEIICPICLDFFTDPVSLSCGHNFCRSCITRSWEKQEKNCCAVCQETLPEKNLTASWALASLAEKARNLGLTPTQSENKLHCEKHREQLKLFCESDMKLLCVVCSHGQEHRGHSFLPIEEAVQFYKDKVKHVLDSLTQRKETALKAEAKQREKISQLKEKVKSLETQVTAEFAKMHQSLTDIEQRVMRDLRQREEEISKRMETNLREIQGKLDSTQQELSELQTQMKKEDLTFLQGQ